MNIQKYYSSDGKYLEEHEGYFSEERLKKEIGFLVNVLKLKKTDKILDLACGQGRHTIELKKRGFNIDGLDFSDYLLKIAKDQAKQDGLKINFYCQDINKINIKTKYDKIFLFFSEFGLFNAEKVMKNVAKILKPGGLFLLDCDNIFRLIQHLIKNPKSSYEFDFVNMKLKENSKDKIGVRYYVFSELEKLFKNNGFKIVSVFGSYKKELLNINSQRMIIVGKK